MKYAQIVSDRVHGVFEYATIPEFATNIVMIPLLDGSPIEAGWLYDGEDFTAPELAVVVEARRITKLALAVRLGVTVEVALETAATTDPVVRVLLGRVSKASYVDLDDPLLEYGLRIFVSKELMTIEQVTEVLDAEVYDAERPDLN
jgi:hypothetical protein